MALHFCGRILIFRNIHGRQLRHINPGTRLENIRQRDAKNNRYGGDHFEIENGFGANTAQLFCITHPGNTNHQRGDNNRHDDHFDQMDKDIARRRQQVDHQPFAAVAMVMQVTP